MKRGLITLVVSIIFILILLFLFRYVYFSEINGKIVDNKGNPIENAEIKISYLCDRLNPFNFMNGGNTPVNLGYRETKTDTEGNFHFNSFNRGFIFNLPFPFLFCSKYITIFKDGYCDKRFYNEGIDKTCRGLYSTSIFVGAHKKMVKLELNKIENYTPSEIPCKIFEGDCRKSVSLKEAILSQNLSQCVEGCKYIDPNGANQFKDNCDIFNSMNAVAFVYECYTEIALAKKDISICNEIYFTSNKAEEVFINLRVSENPEYNTKEFRRRCFSTLAQELKNLSFCDNPLFDDNGMYPYSNLCKFEAVKALGDINKCNLLKGRDKGIFIPINFIPSFKEECNIYLS
jgi:hypothetical protein